MKIGTHSTKRKRFYPRRPLEERFWEKVQKAGEDECWEWLAGKNKAGYGRIQLERVSKTKTTPCLAPRACWYLIHGKWPTKLICHTCDNPGCVNPKHLYEGTDKQNTADMVKRKRLVSNLPILVEANHPLTIPLKNRK